MRKTRQSMLLDRVALHFVREPYSRDAEFASATDTPRVIEMTAKTFEFAPNEIHVKKGERVQIKLRTLRPEPTD